MIIKQQKSQYLTILMVLILVLAVANHHSSPTWKIQNPSELLRTSSTRRPPSRIPEFWKQFATVLDLAAPRFDPPERRGNAKTIGFDQFNRSTEPARQDNLFIYDEALQDLRNAHHRFVQTIYSAPQLSYTPGSRGIVSTASGDYLPVVIISLRMIRRTGCDLPMEIFLATPQEWEAHVCEIVLPALNARCVVLSELHPITSPERISKYQYKIVSILSSSFEEVLFLDADCWPAFDPEEIFNSEPFHSYQLVTFPDYWANSASHYFYDIINQPMPSLSERQSSESGAIFVSKTRHHKSLLLAAYYNFYGPGYYYPLLSQGAMGEGDKETFLAAATALNESFYAVRQGVRSIGHWSVEKGKVVGSAMVQFDPVQDLSHQGNGSLRPLFIHNNFPRMNPKSIWTEHAELFRNGRGEPVLPWTAPDDVLGSFEVDIQRRYWEEILGTACELEHQLESWKDVEGICANTTTYFNNIFSR